VTSIATTRATIRNILATMSADDRRSARDPVVVYDVMHEAASRLVGIYAQRATVGGLDDPAVKAVSAIYDEVSGIDPHNMDAQETSR
jgi:hypothetical protein